MSLIVKSKEGDSLIISKEDLNKYPDSELTVLAQTRDQVNSHYTYDQLQILKAFYEDDMWPFDATWDPELFFENRPFIEEASVLNLPRDNVEKGCFFKGVGFSRSLLLKYPNSFLSVHGLMFDNCVEKCVDLPDYFTEDIMKNVREFYINDAWPRSLRGWLGIYIVNGTPLLYEISDYLLLPHSVWFNDSDYESNDGYEFREEEDDFVPYGEDDSDDEDYIFERNAEFEPGSSKRNWHEESDVDDY